MQNILTIDLEDWYQTQAWRPVARVEEWDNCEGRLKENTFLILDMLREYNTKATFFVVAYNAKRHPEIIRLIRDEGHELAAHGYHHNLIYLQTPKQFRDEINSAKKLIEDIAQEEVIGFRAPSWSITRECLWALDVLLELGFRYDSSIDGAVYKIIQPKFPQGLLEIPRSNFRVLNISFPFAGGFFLRFYPYLFTRLGIWKENRIRRRVVVYMHPWEFDRGRINNADIPMQAMLDNFNLKCAKSRLTNLLKDFDFSSVKDIFFVKEDK